MPGPHIPIANVHRFREKVAVSVGDGSTTYLTPAVARLLGRELIACADDIGTHTFQASPYTPVHITVEG